MFYSKWSMGTTEYEDALALRREVFIEEQQFSPESEPDENDAIAMHLKIYDENGIFATGRLFPDGQGKFHIGRICVKQTHRKMGYGELLTRLLVYKAFTLGVETVYIGAQRSAQGFYQKIGFTPCGEEYYEEFCAHIPMCMPAAAYAGNCAAQIAQHLG